MKFKVGDKAKIIANEHGHNFEIGDIVTISERFDINMNYLAVGELNDGKWYVEDDELEQVGNASSVLTITTSDRVTTLTDGTLTVSVSRYYLDKDNRKIAVREVVNKYFNELDRIEEERLIPKVGDTVTVTNAGSVYSVYKEWLVKNNVSIESAIKWESGKCPEKGGIFKITKLALRFPRPGNQIVYLIENDNEAFIMDGKGIEVVKE